MQYLAVTHLLRHVDLLLDVTYLDIGFTVITVKNYNHFM